jgi:hypothetical protein
MWRFFIVGTFEARRAAPSICIRAKKGRLNLSGLLVYAGVANICVAMVEEPIANPTPKSL